MNLFSKTLIFHKRSIASEIDSTDFLQVHRFYIVNVAKITAVTFKNLTMSNNEMIPVGRKYQIFIG